MRKSTVDWRNGMNIIWWSSSFKGRNDEKVIRSTGPEESPVSLRIFI